MGSSWGHPGAAGEFQLAPGIIPGLVESSWGAPTRVPGVLLGAAYFSSQSAFCVWLEKYACLYHTRLPAVEVAPDTTISRVRMQCQKVMVNAHVFCLCLENVAKTISESNTFELGSVMKVLQSEQMLLLVAAGATISSFREN